MFDFLSRSQEPPPSNTDTVLCTSMDLMTEGLAMTFCLYIPSSLDHNKLKTAVFHAVETKLPRAGARLGYRNGLWEFQIPRQFSDQVPAIGFTCVTHDAAFPSAKYNIPPSTPGSSLRDEPFVTSLPDGSLFRSPSVPLTTAEYLVPNTPLVHVHVATYDDATLIGLTSSHMMFDIGGAKSFFAHWAAALSDRLDEMPEMPRSFSPVQNIALSERSKNGGTPPTSKGIAPTGVSPWPWAIFTIFGLLRLLFASILRLSREGPADTKLVYVPKKWLAEQKESGMWQLKQSGSDEWIGSSDLLTAYITKLVYFGRTDAALVTILFPLNLRRILPDFFPQAYLHNGVTGVTCPVQKASVLDLQPLIDTALLIRRTLTTTSDTAVVEREFSWHGEYHMGKRAPILPDPPSVELAVHSNWLSLELHELDFGGAQKDGQSGTAKPTFVFLKHTDGPIIKFRGVGAVCSEDGEGIWVYLSLGRNVWERVRRMGFLPFLQE